MTRTTIETMTLKFRRIVRETSDERPSLPPGRAARVVTTDGETVSETIRPLAKVIPLAAKLKRIG